MGHPRRPMPLVRNGDRLSMEQHVTPRVSVLMAAFNAAEFVSEAVEDILCQTMSDFELVVVEDGSSDDTLSILQGYAREDDRIVLLENRRNIGLPASLNHGLARCRAPIVARADADDRYMRDRLEQQLRFMEDHPEVGLLSCAIEKIDENGNKLFVAHFPARDGEIRMRELFINSFTHPGAMFRKDLVQEIGGYDVTYSVAQDADLWARLRRRTKAANLDLPLVRYRKHSRSASQAPSMEREQLRLTVRQRAIEEYLRRPVSLDEAGAMVDTFWPRESHPVDGRRLRTGVLGLREVLRRARECESKETRDYFKREVFLSLVAQARQTGRHKMLRFTLISEAIRWQPVESAARVARRLSAGFSRAA